jgi:hypothetical protein
MENAAVAEEEDTIVEVAGRTCGRGEDANSGSCLLACL